MTDDAPDGPGIYLITPALSDAASFLPKLAEALDAVEIACVRLRVARDDEDDLRRAADLVRDVAHERDVAVTLTDHFRLVKPLGLDGVHLENPRLTVRDARKALGEDAIVGAFAGASKHNGMVAAEAGADYVSFGPITANALGDGEVAEPHLFVWWSEMIQPPVVAEGGLTLDLARALAPSVDFLALDQAIWDHPDGPAGALRALVD